MSTFKLPPVIPEGNPFIDEALALEEEKEPVLAPMRERSEMSPGNSPTRSPTKSSPGYKKQKSKLGDASIKSIISDNASV